MAGSPVACAILKQGSQRGSAPPSCTWPVLHSHNRKDEPCLTYRNPKSSGAGARSSWRRGASRARPTARCSPPTARPRCSPLSSREREPKPGFDFFPLTVNYQEKYFASGRIPGGFFKREGRPTEKETLTSRLIDRPIRPLFAPGYKNDTQVVITVLAHDLENDPDIVAHGRGVGRADAFRRSLHGPDRRRARRLHQRRVRAQSAGRPDQGMQARPRRRRHRRRGADGGIGGARAFRGRHARRRHVRPPRLPAGDRRHHRAGREGRQGAARAHRGGPLGALRAHPRHRRRRARARLHHHRQGRAPGRGEGGEGQGEGGALPAGRGGRAVAAGGRRPLQEAGERDRPRPHPRQRRPHRRPRPEDRPPDRRGGGRAAAHPRLGALHPRRDAGAGRRHARHRRGRADDRQPGGHLQGGLHAALQLPALFGGRDRPHGLARPPRDRPRQARLARRSGRSCRRRTSSPTRCASSPRSPSRTARPRWRRCAAPRWR